MATNYKLKQRTKDETKELNARLDVPLPDGSFIKAVDGTLTKAADYNDNFTKVQTTVNALSQDIYDGILSDIINKVEVQEVIVDGLLANTDFIERNKSITREFLMEWISNPANQTAFIQALSNNQQLLDSLKATLLEDEAFKKAASDAIQELIENSAELNQVIINAINNIIATNPEVIENLSNELLTSVEFQTQLVENVSNAYGSRLTTAETNIGNLSMSVVTLGNSITNANTNITNLQNDLNNTNAIVANKQNALEFIDVKVTFDDDTTANYKWISEDALSKIWLAGENIEIEADGTINSYLPIKTADGTGVNAYSLNFSNDGNITFDQSDDGVDRNVTVKADGVNEQWEIVAEGNTPLDKALHTYDISSWNVNGTNTDFRIEFSLYIHDTDTDTYQIQQDRQMWSNKYYLGNGLYYGWAGIYFQYCLKNTFTQCGVSVQVSQDGNTLTTEPSPELQVDNLTTQLYFKIERKIV